MSDLLINNLDTIVVALHGIYGINGYIKKICEDFYISVFDVVYPDLLDLYITFNYQIKSYIQIFHEAYWL